MKIRDEIKKRFPKKGLINYSRAISELDEVVADAFKLEGIEYVIIGGHAVMRYLDLFGRKMYKIRPTWDANVVVQAEDFDKARDVVEKELIYIFGEVKIDNYDGGIMFYIWQDDAWYRGISIAKNELPRYQLPLLHRVDINGIFYPELELLIAMKFYVYLNRGDDIHRQKRYDSSNVGSLLISNDGKFDENKIFEYAKEINIPKVSRYFSLLRKMIKKERRVVRKIMTYAYMKEKGLIKEEPSEYDAAY